VAVLVYRLTKEQAIQLRRLIRRCRKATMPKKERRWLHKGSPSNAAKGFSVRPNCNADFWIERLIGCWGRCRNRTSLGPQMRFNSSFYENIYEGVEGGTAPRLLARSKNLIT